MKEFIIVLLNKIEREKLKILLNTKKKVSKIRKFK